jgi:YhcH/YjgK/YiaL family protein
MHLSGGKLMVIDDIRNAGDYIGLASRIGSALEYLKKTDFTRMEPGKYEIDGNNLYALVQKYNSKMPEEGKWEGHRKYIDIQFVAEGIERIGYANSVRVKAIGEYSDENDFVLFEGNGDFLTVPAGYFAIFAPQDVHMPGITADKPAMIKKVVMKVRIN